MCEIRLPYSEELEKLVLGLCLMSARAIALVSDKIAPSAFYIAKNALIYSTLQEMVDRGETIDLPLFCFFANNRGKLEDCGGLAYISSLLDGLPRCEQKNLILYCNKLRLLSLRREIAKQCYRVTTVNNEIDPDEEIVMLHHEIERYLGFKEEVNHDRGADDARGGVRIPESQEKHDIRVG
jgi:replicative DNA helicase